MNKATLGLDVSTSCIGFTVFNEKGELIEMNYIKFKSNKEQTLFEKADIFQETLKHLKQLDIKFVIIEEPMKKFEGKHSSAATISLLGFFNGIISDRCYRMFGVEPVHYNVKTARSIVIPNMGRLPKGTEKHEVWKRVVEMEPQINWMYNRNGKLRPENYDMCDAYVVGMMQIKRVLEFEEKERNKELSSKEK